MRFPLSIQKTDGSTISLVHDEIIASQASLNFRRLFAGPQARSASALKRLRRGLKASIGYYL
jgi:hypothetical protein